MAIDKNCGETVYWFKNKSGGNHRPLEYVGHGLTVVDGVVQEGITNIYRIHICDPAKVKAYAETSAEYQRLHEEYEAARREAGRDALTRPCEKCGAKIGEACANLNLRKKGEIVRTRWPHSERMKDAVGGKEIS